MARSSIYITEDVTGAATNAPSITFDAVTGFTPSRSRTVTKSPVARTPTSSRSFVSELLSDKGGKVSMEAYVSTNPVIITPNNAIDSENADVRTKAAYLALDKLYKSENTVTIVYEFDTLESYFLTNFEPIIMPSDVIGFRLEFEEVRFASEQRVQLIVNMSDDKAKDAAKKTNAGKGGKVEVTSPTILERVASYGMFGAVLSETGGTLIGGG